MNAKLVLFCLATFSAPGFINSWLLTLSPPALYAPQEVAKWSANGLRAEGLKAEGRTTQGFRGRKLAGSVSGFHSRGLRLESCAAMIPHPKKARGEDAYFTLPDPEANASEVQAAGVADGVGSWREDGVDPGEYPRALMTHASARLVSGVGGGCPADALAFAYNTTRMLGSSTATIVVLKDETLEAVNLGDSGFMLLRRYDEGDHVRLRTVFRSKEQQHGFNMPFQLGSGSRDRPENGERIQVPVRVYIPKPRMQSLPRKN
mmetsp:Transcript_32541/g.50661  ORF Transcript_32541/g.50661 Transcript_32541/m.50661 type:complete len:261 (-) Transcript_32541:708-1490(-)